MTGIIKEHPVSGVFLTALAAAKVIRSGRWHAQQVSDLSFAKVVLDKGEPTVQEGLSLKKCIQLKNMKVLGVRSLSRIPFIPVLMGVSAFYLDKRLSDK